MFSFLDRVAFAKAREDGNLGLALGVRPDMRSWRPDHCAHRRTLTLRPAGLGLAVITLLATAACGSPPASTAPLTSPSLTPASSNDPSGIDHATGPTDVVFRFEQGGGFVPIGFFATQAPQFTLYGDGTVIFRDNSLPVPPQPNRAIVSLAPFQMAQLDERAMQAFLRFALVDSGVGVAKPSYRSANVADAPTSTFTINAGGLRKSVSVEALGFDNPQSPDVAILKALGRLGTQVGSFGAAVEGETTWIPTRWRGVLTPQPTNPSVAWPWTDVAPADFVQHPGADAPQFPIRTMTPAQVAALGLSGIDGGFSGIGLTGPNGTGYTFALRPIFPDEAF